MCFEQGLGQARHPERGLAETRDEIPQESARRCDRTPRLFANFAVTSFRVRTLAPWPILSPPPSLRSSPGASERIRPPSRVRARVPVSARWRGIAGRRGGCAWDHSACLRSRLGPCGTVEFWRCRRRAGDMDNYSLSAGPCMYGLLSWRGPCGVHTGKNDAHPEPHARTTTV